MARAAAAPRREVRWFGYRVLSVISDSPGSVAFEGCLYYMQEYPAHHYTYSAPYIQEQNSLRLESNSIRDVLLLFFSYVALAWKSART
jgi:hypothetical protein